MAAERVVVDSQLTLYFLSSSVTFAAPALEADQAFCVMLYSVSKFLIAANLKTPERSKWSGDNSSGLIVRMGTRNRSPRC